eukprot:TRINITY_DN14832_c0_g3_i1.p1 TRINITY_DN14832_c0_g3~~TRINITY_DN14832_c0_g3_i1.p1  ORF type:complete len:110 (-),score=10.76 TRINITY_DN14832_c0_g3_i1:312-641(-)
MCVCEFVTVWSFSSPPSSRLFDLFPTVSKTMIRRIHKEFINCTNIYSHETNQFVLPEPGNLAQNVLALLVINPTQQKRKEKKRKEKKRKEKKRKEKKRKEKKQGIRNKK